jgi:hypothetical protein
MVERKSKLAAGLLGIFLGSFGVHNFYLGYIAKAIIQVSVTCGSMVLFIILSVISFPLMFIYGLGLLTLFLGAIIMFAGVIGIRMWTLVEGIIIIAGGIKVDGRGVPLKE